MIDFTKRLVESGIGKVQAPADSDKLWGYREADCQIDPEIVSRCSNVLGTDAENGVGWRHVQNNQEHHRWDSFDLRRLRTCRHDGQNLRDTNSVGD